MSVHIFANSDVVFNCIVLCYVAVTVRYIMSCGEVKVHILLLSCVVLKCVVL